MATLYLVEPNTFIQKQGRWFKVKRHGQDIGSFLYFAIDKLVVGGSVCLSPTTIKILLKERIDTYFIGDNGEFLGRLQPPLSKDVEIRMKQYKSFNDINYIKSLLKKIIIDIYYKYKWIIKYKLISIFDNPETSKLLRSSEKKINLLKKSDNIEDIMSFYDTFINEYYYIYGKSLGYDNFKFKFPAEEPINDKLSAMLNFGYNLLYERIIWAINLTGMDPFIYISFGQSSKRITLLEILLLQWKLHLVDEIIWNLFDKNELIDNDFVSMKPKFSGEEDENIYTRDDKIYLSKSAWKKFIVKYEEKLQRIVKYKNSQRTIENIIIDQTQDLANCIIDKNTNYTLFKYTK